MTFRFAELQDAATLANLHAAAFEHPSERWDEAMLQSSLSAPGTFALTLWQGEQCVGFILYRIMGDTAEILTLCIHPTNQRQGLAKKLLNSIHQELKKKKLLKIWLEVAEDNHPAHTLYTQCGYTITGQRKQYYTRPQGRISAIFMEKTLQNPK
jgi:[ribosomal protein S18]-alanine N-acetyltransferase